MKTMLVKFISALRADPVTLIADAGRVACPHSTHDVDVDWCFTCPSFEGVAEGGNGDLHLRCRPVSGSQLFPA